MSGIEVAGLAIGALPLIAAVVTSYHITYDKIHTFRHAGRELKKLLTQMQTHKQNFMNECHLLLLFAAGDQNERKTKKMLDDGSHEAWRDESLNEQFNKYLSDNVEACTAIIEDIKVTLEELEAEFRCFDVFASQKLKGESLKSAIRRVKGSVTFTFEKDRYEKKLASLRERNDDLRHLRSYLVGINQHQQQRPSSLVSSYPEWKQVPKGYLTIQKASKTLHQALMSNWRCSDSRHAGHTAKLCLNAKAEQTVHLDLAISYQRRGDAVSNKDDLDEPPTWLYVQSRGSEHFGTGQLTPEGSQDADPTFASAVAAKNTRFGPGKGAKRHSPELEDLTRASTKRRKVRFAEDDSKLLFALASETGQDSLGGSVSLKPNDAIFGAVNLGRSSSICQYFKERLSSTSEHLHKHCLGYLEAPRDFRHSFYPTAYSDNATTIARSARTKSLTSLEAFLSRSSEESLSIVDRLQLAHKVAVAVLQFHSTPWLSSEWRIQNLAFFGEETQISEDALRTLHLSAHFPESGRRPLATMEGFELGETNAPTSESQGDLSLLFGINNMMLFSLGVALLEFGHRRPLQALRRDQDRYDVVTARRLSQSHTPLGPKYQDIVRKCLQCNFGFGTDLSKPELQRAVYGDVICQLENMIDSLTI